MEEDGHGRKHMPTGGKMNPEHKCFFPNKNQTRGITSIILKGRSKKLPSHAPFHLQRFTRGLLRKSRITGNNVDPDSTYVVYPNFLGLAKIQPR